MKKIISIILCLTMILSLAVAASAASAVSNGDYLIVDGDLAAKALPETYNYGYLYTVSSSSYGNDAIWTIKSSGNYYTITDCYGRYIFSVSDYNSYNVSTSAPADNSHLWTITASGSTYTIQNSVTGKYMGYDTEYKSWGCYPDASKASAVTLKKAQNVDVPEDGTTLTIAEALEYCGMTGDNRYIITGTITEIEGEEYGNMYIKDSTGSIYVYGLYSSDGSLTYSELDKKPVVGDTIKISTKLDVYGDVKELKSCWLLEIVSSNSSSSTDSTTATESTSGSNTSTEATSGSNTSTEATSGNDAATEETPAETIITGVVVSSPTTGTAYKLGVNQKTLSEKLYFAGTTATQEYYLATTTDVEEAVDVYLESVDGGYQMYFMDGKTKTYIDIYKTDTGYVNVRLTTAPTAVFTWSSTYNTFVTTVEDTQYYIGAYYSYNTLSASKCSYLDDPDGESYSSSMYVAKEVPATGDTISVFVALLAVSAMGIAVIGKKKEF